MQSGDKGHLGSMFDDFEFEPRPELWDRIESESVGPEQAGHLAPLYEEYTHAPHSRVWRAIANQLQPVRRRRAVIWWSVAAGLAILVTLGVFMRSGESKSQEFQWAAGEEAGRLVRDAETGNFVKGSETVGNRNHPISWGDSLKAFFASGNGNCINLSPFNLPVINFDWNPIPNGFSYYNNLPQSVNDFLANHGPQEPLNFPNLQVPSDFSNVHYPDAEDRFALNELSLFGMESRTPNLLEMESNSNSFALSYVGMAEVKKERRALETRLGSNLSPTASLIPGEILNYQNADQAFTMNGGGVTSLSSENHNTTVENFQTPISIGFSLQWYFGKRLSLLPGLTFTRMKSEIQEIQGREGIVYNITRDYFGPSVGLQYDLIQRERYHLYATGGLQFDTGIRLGYSTTRVENGLTLDATQEKTTAPLGPQAAGSLGMGMRYDLGKRIGIYAQGTMVNYFYQAQPNLWSQQPFWPSVQIGLSMRL